jgi:ABC-type dipeptide/oligopeptide/nickel transport system permease component
MLGTSLVVGLGVVLGSLLADVLYGVADPRVRYQ